jgi:hypothetical protein
MKRLLLVLALLLALVPTADATIYTSQRVVGTTPTKLSINTNSQLLLVNQSTTTSVFIGSDTVTTTTGVEIKAGATLSVQLATGEALYGIVTAGTVRVDTLENAR